MKVIMMKLSICRKCENVLCTMLAPCAQVVVLEMNRRSGVQWHLFHELIPSNNWRWNISRLVLRIDSCSKLPFTHLQVARNVCKLVSPATITAMV